MEESGDIMLRLRLHKLSDGYKEQASLSSRIHNRHNIKHFLFAYHFSAFHLYYESDEKIHTLFLLKQKFYICNPNIMRELLGFTTLRYLS